MGGGILANKRNMNYYNKLKAHYYKMFPEELKLEFGCEVESGDKVYNYCGAGKDATLFFRECYQGANLVIVLKEYKILGKDIDIREVLRMLNKHISSRIGYITIGGILMKGDKVLAKLNLSISLKDQSEDTLNKLLELVE